MNFSIFPSIHSGSSWRFWFSCRYETQENVAENASEWRASRASSFGSSNRWFSIFVFPFSIEKNSSIKENKKKKTSPDFSATTSLSSYFFSRVREFIRVKAKAMRYGVGWNGTNKMKWKNWTESFPKSQNSENVHCFSQVSASSTNSIPTKFEIFEFYIFLFFQKLFDGFLVSFDWSCWASRFEKHIHIFFWVLCFACF